eukprot:c43165_g1_i1.p2 GENE.c43165_g1_i1~~c43165_g1_i1.p2  ORF type:complete len:147 (+),score=29.40 c43165_g1_i1:118-558(+)
MQSSVFVIVGANDNLLFELDNVQRSSPSARVIGLAGAAGGDVLTHFLLHSSLDIVDLRASESKESYLKCVETFHYGDGIDWLVSAFVTAGGIRMLLLHDQKNEDGIRAFFLAVQELLVKHLLNPFYKQNSAIVSPAFEERVTRLMR